ncbi:hypothetical protein VB695_14165 [Nodularia spumigena UHCC 0060]|uniref:Uncharacterized protein n=1 Tax=Nodularia spumigena UHCC 0060 TaxID=3110300 RepID=A0ABU5USG0_NODSP|nr:hypothetical protein [Nodularia spumigena UHCC 0060]
MALASPFGRRTRKASQGIYASVICDIIFSTPRVINLYNNPMSPNV